MQVPAKWTPDEWRNHGADRLCDIMYYNNSRIRPEMFVHGRKWYWKHDNQRIVDNNRNIYTDILAHESLQALCEGADIEYNDADWIATGLVFTRPLRLEVFRC